MDKSLILLLKQVTREEQVKIVLSCLLLESIQVALFWYYGFRLFNVDNHVIVKFLQALSLFLIPVLMVVTFGEGRRQWIRASKELKLLDLMLKTGDFDE